MANRDFQLQIMKHQNEWADANTPEVEFSFDTLNGEMADLPQKVGGQTIRPLDGNVEALSFSLKVLDKNEGVTSILSDDDGRMQLVQRVARWRRSSDGGSNWTTVATGRISEISLADSVTSFDVTISDEMWLLRNREFPRIGANEPYDADTSLYPAGVLEDWHFLDRIDDGLAEVKSIDGNLVTLRTIERLTANGVESFVLSSVDKLISEDAKADTPRPADTTTTEGDFHSVRAEVTSAGSGSTGEYEIVLPGLINDGKVGHEVEHEEYGTIRRITEVTLVWPTNQPSVGEEIRFYLYMPEGKISQDYPLHFGGPAPLVDRDGFVDGISGIHPVQFAKDVIQNEDVLINTSSFDTVINNKELPKITPRIEETTSVFEALQKKVFEPFGVVPFINGDGEIEIASFLAATKDDINNVDNLSTLDSENISGEDHPTFIVLGNEQVTSIDLRFRKISNWVKDKFGGSTAVNPRRVPGTTVSADTVAVGEFKPKNKQPQHDRVDTYGDRSIQRVIPIPYLFQTENLEEAVFTRLFERFGDAPVRTKVLGLLPTQSFSIGQFVVLNLESYPNLQTGSRGGDRIMQVVSRGERVPGTEIELLDAGPKLQPLSAPSISVDSTSISEIDITVGGSGGTGSAFDGDEVIIQIAAESGGSPPSENSDKWTTALKITSQGSYTLTALLPGHKYWIRGRQGASQRIASDWSTPVSGTTNSISAPTNLSVDDDLGCALVISWTNNTEGLINHVLLDDTIIARVGAKTTKYTIHDLDTSTEYTIGVRAVADAGGSSPTTEITHTTKASADSGPVAGPMFILLGETS